MSQMLQASLFDEAPSAMAEFPRTRYQGSKAKIADWIIGCTHHLKMDTVLDAFGGTGVVGYSFKKQGKNVVYNDVMTFNSIIGKALIENQMEILPDEVINRLLSAETQEHGTLIQDLYHDIFFTDEENQWLDQMVYKIGNMENEYQQAIAWFALLQSCIIKRPYNLFHRANLYVRMSNVKRSFGNKTTWDGDFRYYFRKFAQEANAAIFDSGKRALSLNQDALTIVPETYGIDAVYIDTPYISSKGVGTDYFDFYGFLEGMVHYDTWRENILPKYKHKPIKGKGDKTWTSKEEIYQSFDKLFRHFQQQTLIVSYRSDGIPSVEELLSLLKKYKSDVSSIYGKNYQYVLSPKQTKEILIIAQ